MNVSRLKEAVMNERFSRGITQGDLAKLSGVSIKPIINLEAGRGSSEKSAYKVLKVFNPGLNWSGIVQKYGLDE